MICCVLGQMYVGGDAQATGVWAESLQKATTSISLRPVAGTTLPSPAGLSPIICNMANGLLQVQVLDSSSSQLTRVHVIMILKVLTFLYII